MPPLVVEACRLPTPVLRRAADAGQIVLRSWADEHTHAPFADRAWLLRSVRGASAFVGILPTPVDTALLDAAGPSLRVVSTMSVGVDHIDVGAARARGVRVGHTPQVLDGAVADLTLALALAVTRRMLEGERVVRAGAWPGRPWNPLDFVGPALTGKTIGFFGFGGIAQTVVSRLLPFRPARIVYTVSQPRALDLGAPAFRTLAADPYIQLFYEKHRALPLPIENVSRDALAREADIVIVLASLNAHTRHVVDASFLAAMKPSAYLVNVARGPLVDTAALVDALHAQQIAGAALDVVEGEPDISAVHPLLAPELADRVVVMPHIGSATREAREAMADVCAQNALGGIGIGAMPAEI